MTLLPSMGKFNYLVYNIIPGCSESVYSTFRYIIWVSMFFKYNTLLTFVSFVFYIGKDPDHILRKASMKRSVDKPHDEHPIPLKRKIIMRPNFQKQKIAFEGQNAKKAETKLSIKLKKAVSKVYIFNI